MKIKLIKPFGQLKIGLYDFVNPVGNRLIEMGFAVKEEKVVKETKVEKFTAPEPEPEKPKRGRKKVDKLDITDQ